mgnify:CR=1 FL=1
MDGATHALLAVLSTLAAGRISGWWRGWQLRARHSL